MTSRSVVFCSPAEKAAVLAGLRVLQIALADQAGLPQGIEDILTNNDQALALDLTEIDELAERINT